MGTLHQIQFQVVAVEDRLLMRVSTHDRNEFRLWVTRRFAKLLWPVLTRMVTSSEPVTQQTEAHSKSAVMSFQHERALSQSDFKTAFRGDAKVVPLGDSPILLAKAQVKKRSDGVPILALHPAKGQGLELAMNETLLHSFCKLLIDASSKAGWDLNLGIARVGANVHPAPERVN